MIVANDDQNGVFNLANQVAGISPSNISLGNISLDSISPGQTSMFDENQEVNVTRMDIGHQDSTTVRPPDMTAKNDYINHQADAESVPNGTKARILAALAIVGIAGYIAYWVQEPVQLKADVLNGGPVDAKEVVPAAAEEKKVAAIGDIAPDLAGKKANVDISLFGFEPAALKVDKETTVIWTNSSTENQTIIGSTADGKNFASPVLATGQTFSYKFDQDASFEYYSTYNPALKATITVGLGSVNVNSPKVNQVVNNSSSNNANLDTLFASAPEENNTILASNALNEGAIVPTEAKDGQLKDSVKAAEELKPAAAAVVTPSKLSETGPGDALYSGILLGVVWLNRKKLVKVFQK